MVLKTQKFRPQWEEIFASLGDGIVVLNQQKRLTGINPAAESITGFSAESILGHLVNEAFAGNRTTNERILEMLGPAFQEGKTLTLREVSWAGRSGKSAFVDLSVTPLVSDEGDLNGWVLVFRDVTPLKKLEEDIRKADRLAMMGTLAAGLAHEIKNPLGGIRGAAQLLERENLAPDSRECLGIIVREVDRVNRLVNELLSFTKPKEISFEEVNLNELLDSLCLLQKNPLREKGIRVTREFDPSLPLVWGNTDQLRQVFLNCFNNAMEAIPHRGGEIRLGSRFITNYRIKEVDGKKLARMVMAEIQDNGVGVKNEDYDKLFTPFFTTKESGYGLGLSLAHRVVQEHGGSIQFRSEPGKGTTIQIFLRSCA